MDDPIQALIREFSRLPGVGGKTAARLTFHLLREGPAQAQRLAAALVNVAENVRLCEACCMPTRESPCAYCADTRRDDGIICVVEKPQNVLAIERTGEYRGRYHVLHGAISPLEGRGPDDIRVRELLARLAVRAAREVMLALNPTVEGDATALYLAGLLRPLNVTLTRLAQGVPIGADLEFADRMTLARAIEARRAV